MMIIGLTGIFAVLAFVDIPRIVAMENAKIKGAVVYTLIILAAYIVSLLQVIRMAPPSPAVVIGNIIRSLIGED